MIHTVYRDLFSFEREVDALVNPVNCVGVMGKGVALEFKRRYPRNFNEYVLACRRREIRPGVPLLVAPDRFASYPEPAIINFPTKGDWRAPSQLEWIRYGLRYLAMHAAGWRVRSIAMPRIGCGLGGLVWGDVYQEIVNELGDSGIEVYITSK